MDIANNILMYGVDIFTAARASLPTPLLTNIPSTIEYNENTHIAATEGITYFLNCDFKLIEFSI
ncbi:hypothetical protein SDC9_199605 [bioreactor metagenome]|uniref:Uncharacterized protein n=1 Tax=bioreactor metagenome TaxID=1076179 RepID=A0A645IU78_9ZZZZ